ncbi:MAG: hypothetical protein GY811_00540 [Myxococcales bacterium]|nr:hypothetical protein [Myxococcales bacterium]
MRNSLVLTAVLALSTAAPGIANAQRRNERVVVTMRVDSWTPHEGAPGTLVTLSGTGFTRSTRVLVDGRPVRPTKMGARSISFRMPANAGDGRIVLRKSGVANDYVVGNFDLWADPNVANFGPASGTYGTRVAIRGRNFSQSDQVMLGQQPLAIESWNETSLVVTIPNGATSGFFTVRSARNAESRSRQQFRVVQPAPFITDFAPLSGEPGSVLRIRGGNYGNDIAVSYGRQPMRITATGAGWIDVVIPTKARRSKAISIRSRRGNVRSASPFALSLPPVMGSYSPAWGSVGTQVTLNGANFTANDRVTLGGASCRIIQLTGNRIIVEIPPNARSGAFAIHRDNQSIKAASRFDVAYTPIISNFSAMAGTPGTRVIMTGQYLDGARLYLGNTEIRPTSRTDNQWQFTIPPRATSGNFRIAGRAGQASWAVPFQVWNFPSIRRVAPARGAVGSTVTLQGNMLANASQVFLGDVEMPIVTRSGSGQIVVRVPPNALSGRISWTAYGKNTPTRWNYDVLRAPILSSYSPMEGASGTLVTIVGQGFDRSTRVRYGNSPARITQWEPGRLKVEIPRSARRSDYLSVVNAGGGTTAGTPFGLLIAPTVKSWAPRSAKPGMEMTINGSGLAMDTTVQIGGMSTKVLRVGPRGRNAVVAVPALSAGSYDVSVQYRGLRSVARKRFQVDGWAQVTGINPGHGRVGDTIMLTGAGLNVARIYCGNVEFPISRSDRRGRKLWVTIAQGCTGRGQLTVVDGQNQAMSSVWLQVDAPAPPPPAPIVRDHRKKDKGPAKRPGPKVRDHRKKDHR